ncbi:MAG: hypothetical protein ACREU0_01780, partial [Burkholderiales bacterium]
MNILRALTFPGMALMPFFEKAFHLLAFFLDRMPAASYRPATAMAKTVLIVFIAVHLQGKLLLKIGHL